MLSGYVEFKKRKEAENALSVYGAELNHAQTELARCKENLEKSEGLEKRLLARMRRTYTVHQVFTTYKKPRITCLTAIVQADDAADAVRQFEQRMKPIKENLKIRTAAPVFAKPVFPDVD